MPAPAAPLIYGALSAAAVSLTAGLFGESPAEAAQRTKLKYATVRATRVMNPVEAWRAMTGGVIVIPTGSTADVVGGSEDASGILGGTATPAEALAQIDRLDEKWGPAVDHYRSLHSVVHTTAQQERTGEWGRRYPTRWAVQRLTMDALFHGDALAEKYGARWGITDPQTGKIKPEWLQVVATYATSDQEWSEIHRQVEEHYAEANAPDSSWLDVLKDGLALASAAVAGQWGAVARAVFGGGNAGGATVGARVMSREELAILYYLRARMGSVQVSRFNRDFSRANVYQVRLTALEALSGGGTPLRRGLSSLGGIARLAAELRKLDLTLPTKSVTDETLVLKAVAVARRKPTPGADSTAYMQTITLAEYGNAAIAGGPT